MIYQMATAEAVCNDATKETYEVRAVGADGKKWTVSDSSQMTVDEAEALAKAMRDDGGEVADAGEFYDSPDLG